MAHLTRNGAWLVLMLAPLSCAGLHSLASQGGQTESTHAATNEEQAVHVAHEALGTSIGERGERAALATSSGIVGISDDFVPFIANEFNGRRCWEISITDTVRGENDLGQRRFDVFVDSATGVALRVVTRSEDYDAESIHKAPASATEKQMTNHFEWLVGVPDSVPEVSLFEALRKSRVSAYQAMELDAKYVIWTRDLGDESKSRSVWMIQMHGGFTYPVGGTEGFPIEKLSNYRMVVDAETGELLASDNLPLAR